MSLNPDARAAVEAARTGRCRDAMKYLNDAAPHSQSKEACLNYDSAEARDFRHAMVIVAGKCTVNVKNTQYKSPGFTGGRRRRSAAPALNQHRRA